MHHHVMCGWRKVKSPQNYFSIATGKMTAILTKSGYPGEYHYGRDTLFSAHTSSAVVPKGSHLKASKAGCSVISVLRGSCFLHRTCLTRTFHG